MFEKDVYIARREELRRLVGKGVILLFGNNEAPMNYPANSYTPMRQDSTFLYYFGLHREGLVGVLDADSGQDTLLGDDVSVEDIVWLGSVGTVRSLAESVGVVHSAPMEELGAIVRKAQASGQKVHYLPPYRHDTMIQLMYLLTTPPAEQREKASLPLIKAVVEMRLRKTPEEVTLIDRACNVGYLMHTRAMSLCCAGVRDKYIAGQMDGVALSMAQGVSFPTICTQRGEIMHGVPQDVVLENGRLLLCDAGCEKDDYCSDHTRTMPISGHFTQQQREVYDIVVDCHDMVLSLARPEVKWMDVHFDVCRLMTSRLKDLGLMKGNVDEAVEAGAHALFMPHGLGHNLGMDVHDMEGLGQVYVGFDDEVRPRLDQFGTDALRMGKRLKEGYVVTDEPGIYFIPDLIDAWRTEGRHKEFINYEALEAYEHFGGIRIEDDLLITSNGCRFLGERRIPYKAEDVETYMAEQRETTNE